MNPPPAPVPYRVEYSVAAREHLRPLARAARERGDGEAFLAAVTEFDRRLRVYPQFGEPVIDLNEEVGQVWIGFVRPISMRYAVLDDRRLVLVAALPVLLPKSKDNDAD